MHVTANSAMMLFARRSRMNWIIPAILALCASLSAQALPNASSTLFAGSGQCVLCHLPGAPNPSALLDNGGHDVSPVSHWRGTMMANAAKDPFWQAKVSAEVMENPHIQVIIDDKCTTCHMPMARTEAHYTGTEAYALSEGLEDPLALDGVSCTLCHQIQPDNLDSGESFSGHYSIEDERSIFGPFSLPVTGPMQSMVNYTPVHGPFMTESELCATCHTLFTPYLDNEGEIAGEAPEQTPYLEWLNSTYVANGVTCQACHMPVLAEGITISNRPVWLSDRSPYGPHHFVGGNAYALQVLDANAAALALTSGEAALDSTLSRTQGQLHQRTAHLDLTASWSPSGAELDVTLTNLSGHKFPTAFPSRRAWLEVLATGSDGDTLFHSGGWNETTGRLMGLDSIYEPHHDLITSEEQVQIYQAIPHDVDGQKTYTLLRIAGYLKDNRIPPQGYRNDGPAADSTRIEGQAWLDNDFNFEGSTEGSGTDIVHYLMSTLDPEQTYSFQVKLWYQSLSPRFLQDLLSHDHPLIAALEEYTATVPNQPALVAAAEVALNPAVGLDAGPVLNPTGMQVTAFPNPFNATTTIRYQLPAPGTLEIFDVNGRQVAFLALESTVGKIPWTARATEGQALDAGVYLGRYQSGQITGLMRMIYLK